MDGETETVWYIVRKFYPHATDDTTLGDCAANIERLIAARLNKSVRADPTMSVATLIKATRNTLNMSQMLYRGRTS